eukprot:6739079-Alexandrium_andersonii.AAC.1
MVDACGRGTPAGNASTNAAVETSTAARGRDPADWALQGGPGAKEEQARRQALLDGSSGGGASGDAGQTPARNGPA